MSNIAKIEVFMNKSEEIRDHLDRPMITGRLFSSLAWSAGTRIVRALNFIEEDLNATLAKLAEQHKDDDEARIAAQENTIKEIHRQEQQIEDLKNLFSWASAHTYTDGAKPENIVDFVSSFDEKVQDDDVVDMEALEEDVQSGDLTRDQANQLIADAVKERLEQNERQERWFKERKESLIQELTVAQKTHPGEFEISDRLCAALLEKMGDKVDTILHEMTGQRHKRSLAPRRRRAINANRPLMKKLLNDIDEAVITIQHAIDGAGSDPDGVH
jgi:hypothetical protein